MTEEIKNDAATPPAADAKAPKVATLADNVRPREIYQDFNSAVQRFAAIQQMQDAVGLVTLITGLTATVDADGNPVMLDDGVTQAQHIDEKVLALETTHEIMIAKLTRVEKPAKPGEKGVTVLVALLVHPIPRLESLVGVPLAVEGSNSFVDGTREIMRKEMEFRSKRPLRKALTGAAEAPSLQSLTGEMPLTLTEFIEGSQTSGGIMESFDAIQREVLQLLNKQSKLFARAKFNKAEFRKALESAAYAQFHYSAIEERGRFVEVLEYMKAFAGKKGMNTDIFDTWISTRNAQSYDPTVDTDEDDELDLMAQLGTGDAKPAAEPTA